MTTYHCAGQPVYDKPSNTPSLTKKHTKQEQQQQPQRRT
jgi:hypothetical protein